MSQLITVANEYSCSGGGKAFTCVPITVRKEKMRSEYVCVHVLEVWEVFCSDSPADSQDAACNTRRGSRRRAGQTSKSRCWLECDVSHTGCQSSTDVLAVAACESARAELFDGEVW